MHVYNKFWLAPVFFGLLILGGLPVAAKSTALSPFIYAIFLSDTLRFQKFAQPVSFHL